MKHKGWELPSEPVDVKPLPRWLRLTTTVAGGLLIGTAILVAGVVLWPALLAGLVIAGPFLALPKLSG